MAGPFDSIMKRMIGLHPEDFAKWLDHEATFVQALDIELKSQHIFADALLKITRNGKPALEHLECQTSKDPEMAVRLLEYDDIGVTPISSYSSLLVCDLFARRWRGPATSLHPQISR